MIPDSMIGEDPRCQGCRCGTCIENPMFACNFECSNCCICLEGERLVFECEQYQPTMEQRFRDMSGEGAAK